MLEICHRATLCSSLLFHRLFVGNGLFLQINTVICSVKNSVNRLASPKALLGFK